MVNGPEDGLALLARLADELEGYHLLHVARAELLRRAGRLAEAREAYEAAITCCVQPVELRHLERRREERM